MQILWIFWSKYSSDIWIFPAAFLPSGKLSISVMIFPILDFLFFYRISRCFQFYPLIIRANLKCSITPANNAFFPTFTRHSHADFLKSNFISSIIILLLLKIILKIPSLGKISCPLHYDIVDIVPSTTIEVTTLDMVNCINISFSAKF